MSDVAVAQFPPVARRPPWVAFRSLLVRVFAVLVLFGVWQLLALAEVWPPAILPGPGQVWQHLLST